MSKSPHATHGVYRDGDAALRLVIDEVPALISYVDARGHYQLVNRSYQKWFGISAEEVTGKHLRDVLGEEAYALILPHVESALQGKRVQYQAQVPYRTGGTRFIHAEYVPDIQPNGKVAGFYALVTDITESKRSEEVLRIRARQQRSLAQISEFAMGHELQDVLDHAARAVAETLSVEFCKIMEIQPGGAEMLLCAGFGWAPGLVGSFREPTGYKSQAGYTLLSDHPIVVDDLRTEERFQHPPLLVEHHVISGMTCIIRQPDGGPWGAIGAHSNRSVEFTDDDVSFLAAVANMLGNAIVHKRSQNALREQTRTLEALNRVGSELAAELDTQKLIQSVTDAATEVTGAKFGAFFFNAVNEQGESFMLYTLSGAPREAFEKFGIPRNTPLFGPTFAGEGIVRCDDVTTDPRYGHMAPHHGMPEGHLPVRSYLAAPVVSRSGAVLGGLFFGHPEPGVFDGPAENVVRGIASQAAVALDNARLYESLRESERQLREADRRKDEFLAMLAHELRNPLAPLRNGLQIMRISEQGDEAFDQARTMMERQLAQMVRLIDDLLDLSRITGGKIELRRERVALAAIVQQAIETSRPAMEQAGHHLTVQMPSTPIFVNADPTRLSQVFSNLLNNAAKFTPHGGEIGVSIEQRNEKVAVSVCDNGIGIPNEKLRTVFEMFTQVDPSLEKSQGGLGIGLTLVKRLVEMHGGRVIARSEGSGKGSEFIVFLPVAAASEETKTEPSGPGERADAPRRRILVVDDSHDSAASLALLLDVMGNETRTAYSGLEALEVGAAFHPDVILLDIGMPILNGYDTCRRIREQDWGKGITIIALTGWGQEDDRRRSRESGFTHHLVKPVEPAVLERLLAEPNPPTR